MQIACGTDIIEIERIKKSIERNGDRFFNQIYTTNEIEYCESRGNAKFQHFAARFAAKEAIFKALTSIVEDKFSISWKNLEIINDENGRPHINFLGVHFSEIQSIDISISHCKEYAVASVVMLYKKVVD